MQTLPEEQERTGSSWGNSTSTVEIRPLRSEPPTAGSVSVMAMLQQLFTLTWQTDLRKAQSSRKRTGASPNSPEALSPPKTRRLLLHKPKGNGRERNV